MNDYFGRPTQQFNNFTNTPYMGNFQPQMAQPQPVQMRTNKIFVTSLEDALNRYAEPNTIMIYRHQDEKFEYEITTDAQGKKMYKTLQISEYSTIQGEKQSNPNIISTEDINGLKSRIKALEEYVEDMKRIKKNEGGIE